MHLFLFFKKIRYFGRQWDFIWCHATSSDTQPHNAPVMTPLMYTSVMRLSSSQSRNDYTEHTIHATIVIALCACFFSPSVFYHSGLLDDSVGSFNYMQLLLLPALQVAEVAGSLVISTDHCENVPAGDITGCHIYFICQRILKVS